MKILLDESLPRKLRHDFSQEYEVLTVRDMGWLAKKNGELLKLMAKNNFDFFITVDRNPPITFLPAFYTQLLNFKKHKAFPINK